MGVLALLLVDSLKKQVWLRVTVREGGKCRFSYSQDGEKFTPAGEGDFTATVGLFAAGAHGANADFDWFQVGPAKK